MKRVYAPMISFSFSFFFGRSSPVAFGALTRIEWNAGKVGQFLRYEGKNSWALKKPSSQKRNSQQSNNTHTTVFNPRPKRYVGWLSAIYAWPTFHSRRGWTRRESLSRLYKLCCCSSRLTIKLSSRPLSLSF
jgi:hypothetical protein